MTEGMSLGEFFSHMDRLVEPVIRLHMLNSKIREINRQMGIKEEPKSPKWARRKKGERWDSDKGYTNR